LDTADNEVMREWVWRMVEMTVRIKLPYNFRRVLGVRKAGPVGFEPTTFGSLHFIGAGARCPILAVLADDCSGHP